MYTQHRRVVAHIVANLTGLGQPAISVQAFLLYLHHIHRIINCQPIHHLHQHSNHIFTPADTSNAVMSTATHLGGVYQ